MHMTEALKDAIFDKLRSGAWRPGERIPTERELSVMFAVSRTTVRKVLADFKQDKLITQTVGSGTYVSDTALESLQKLAVNVITDHVSPPELLNARLVLEPAIVEMVVYNATLADFASMEKACDMAERAETHEKFAYWDKMFHEAVAVAAHNNLLLGVFRLINQCRAQSEWGLLKKRNATPERRGEYQEQHRALLAALKQRDPLKAKQVITEHLMLVRHHLFGY